MNKTIMGVSIALVALLFIGGVYAYQNNIDKNTTNNVNKAAGQSAVESGDYNTWKTLHEGTRMASVITEDNFYLMQEMHEAMQSGDYEKAQEIRSGLGLGRGMQKNCPMRNLG